MLYFYQDKIQSNYFRLTYTDSWCGYSASRNCKTEHLLFVCFVLNLLTHIPPPGAPQDTDSVVTPCCFTTQALLLWLCMQER